MLRFVRLRHLWAAGGGRFHLRGQRARCARTRSSVAPPGAWVNYLLGFGSRCPTTTDGVFPNPALPHQSLATGLFERRLGARGPARSCTNCLSKATLISLGGATEATVWSNFYTIAEVPSHWTSIPYGKPIQNAQYYILDPGLNPCPIGVAGELYIGGPCLSSGYFNDPIRTAEKFIPNPFNRQIGSRLYQTGDLARYWPDGNIEFLGRIDHQVKIRGYRIELGEIETVICTHPDIRDALVLAREDLPGGKQLVAYIVPRCQSVPTRSELYSFLQNKLPDYMVPKIFVPLAMLPITPNGKVDRRALPLPDPADPQRDTTFAPPQTPTELKLTALWSKILGIGPVGLHDNFFNLGGHSLLATQVISQVRKAFQVELPLQSLFEAPTVAQLAERIEAVTQAAPALATAPIASLVRTEPLPLSFAQQRLWFFEQLRPGQATYNIPIVVRLRGPLNGAALEQSFNEILRRHEVLRTCFVVEKGQPMQKIAAELRLSVLSVDLRALPRGDREPEIRRLARQDALTPFDLVQEPLLRASLLHLDSNEHVVLLTMHHIVSDGWSMGVLIRELVALYDAFAAGQPSPLPELSLQYGDFALWQRQQLQGDMLAAQLDYWRQHLGEQPPVLDLPMSRPRPALQTFQGARQSLTLPAPLVAALKTLSARAGVTLFMTLLAAFQALLYRYTGQDNMVVGIDVANRNQAETEGLIGFFVNQLALRTDLSGNPTFQTLLERVRGVTLGAYDHQDLPFDKLVEALNPTRDLSRAPLFQVKLVLQNAPMPPLELSGLTLSLIDIDHWTAELDLVLNVAETETGLTASLEYNTDLFDAPDMVQMLRQFETLLVQVTQQPDLRLNALAEALTADDRAPEPLTPADDLTDRCIHHLFQHQVASSPDAIAVVFDNQALTYAELNDRANRLAHYLQTQGVGPEVRVGISLARSLDMMVGLLGILKAGGTYVPLDPAYPKARLTFMVEDAQIRVLLTQKHLLDEFPDRDTPKICLDTDWAAIARESGENPTCAATAENLAYIIYTSGSTGTPKGVQVSHRNLVCSTQARLDYYAEPVARFLGLPSFAFDSSVAGIFWTLCQGGTFVLPQHDLLLDLANLSRVIAQARISHVLCLPSLYALLLEKGKLEDLAVLRVAIVAGETCPSALVSRHLALLPETALFNEYGPTEGTVWSSVFQCQSPGTRPGVPIGRPIATMQMHLLDDQMHPVPLGEAGELYIGGEGLARGYWQRPDLTAETFRPNPFGHNPGARLYRTGDLARCIPDGTLEFLGRRDHQVKIRGYRIELGEIETVLAQHKEIREAVVLAQPDESGNPRLVVYVVPSVPLAPTAAALRRHLQESVPEYMVPAVFRWLPTFPLNVNGKVDRQALLALGSPCPELEAFSALPQGDLERTLAAVWQAALHRETVGLHDNFFDLGGHSLLMAQVHSHLQDLLPQAVSMLELFQYPTISALAQYLRQAPVQSGPQLPSGDRIQARTEGKHRLKQRLMQKQPAVIEQ